jgi:hypothetical protein
MRPRVAACLVATTAAGLLVAAPARAQPANDAFAAAQALSGLPAGASGSNVGATLEPGEPRHGEFSVGSVWYSWTAPATQTVTIDTCSAGYDTLLAVYTGTSLGDLRRVGANDDACGLHSRVRFQATAGTTYFIAVDGSEDNGSFTLSITPPPEPREGRYVGRALFGERIAFFVRRKGAFVANFTFRNVDLICPRGLDRIRRFTLPGLIPVRRSGRRFSARVSDRAGQYRISVRISGRLLPPRRARGTIRIRTFHPAVGRCRYPFGSVDWSARR